MIKEWDLVDFILFIEENKKHFLCKPIYDSNWKVVHRVINYMPHKNHKDGGFMWVSLIDDDHVYSTSELGKFKIKKESKIILRNMYNTRVNVDFGHVDVFYRNCTQFIFDQMDFKKYEDCVIYTYENYIPKKKGTNSFIPIKKES